MSLKTFELFTVHSLSVIDFAFLKYLLLYFSVLTLKDLPFNTSKFIFIFNFQTFQFQAECLVLPKSTSQFNFTAVAVDNPLIPTTNSRHLY